MHGLTLHLTGDRLQRRVQCGARRQQQRQLFGKEHAVLTGDLGTRTQFHTPVR